MSGRPFTKVLVANRGEIAIRVFRALRDLDVGSVAVYSDADRGALHPRRADEAHALGGMTAAESYLVIEKLLDVARRSGAEAIHPGYGFLSENATFAQAVLDAGLTWIGPPPSSIELMGSKTRARQAMQAAGVPIIPGTTDPVATVDEVVALGDSIGYPLLIKAAAGGGGKGMEVVRSADEAARAFATAQRQGLAYFANAEVYVERYLDDPRHVEVQILADRHGNVIHLGERDCTIQRRHQKLVEETPSPAVDEALRNRIGAIAIDAARAAGYESAGTIEGLLSDGEYYFMEMNTRIQVEHTVTEEVTGFDLVREQIRVAAGEPLSITQAQVALRGHAIECRINAEAVAHNFLPSPGTITDYEEPSGPGVRVDSGVAAGSVISPLYDPMIAKLVVHGSDREHARARMLRALSEFRIGGVETLVGFHQALLSHQAFIDAETCHGLVESKELADKAAAFAEPATPSALPGPRAYASERTYEAEIDGRLATVRLFEAEPEWVELARRHTERAKIGGHAAEHVESPMQGTVLKVDVAEGENVVAGKVLCVVEAMKMENEIVAHRAGVIADLAVSVGDAVSAGSPICSVLDHAS
ncbi:MAG: acetyl-CoA carboxylase biotin carboxylase subunit [Actinobacteria bacterium]|uniref:Unannotated protein n=1 Tax=freshwater metagenome TaxID=449393 RepID=A0A6J6PE20_9ZZZZ|nr:acetyl-CoA carboxylase biotin carboxylase subunit [Actinomycetota bacterium]